MLFPRRLRLLRRSLILGVLAALAVFVPGVAAHAELVRSVPESDAVLAQAPDRIELFFSEAVDPNFTVIQVLNSSAAPVDKHDTRLDPADPTHVTVSLPALPDGVYTVSWRALSAADGHVTSGAFPFTVGLFDQARVHDDVHTRAERLVWRRKWNRHSLRTRPSP